MATLAELITSVRNEINDNATNVNKRFSDANLTDYINTARAYTNMSLLEYINQQFILPELYIDEYDLESDFIRAGSMIDVLEQMTIPSGDITRESADDVVIWYDNRIAVNKTRKKIIFGETPKNIQGELYISGFDRDTDTIKINKALGMGTLTSVDTAVEMITGNTNTLVVGYKITCSGDTIAIASITDDYNFVLASAPSPAWDEEGFTYTKSDDTVPHVPDFANIKPYIKLIDHTGSVVEYIRVSHIQANLAKTEYTLYVTGWNLKNIDTVFTLTAGDGLRAVSFLLNYISKPKALSSSGDIDALSPEAENMVIFWASRICFTVQSLRTDVDRMEQKFIAQRQEVIDQQNQDKAADYNNTSPEMFNRFKIWY